ncbi:MAG TPA: TlpA disulfide reductase family protein [Candidatus Limnocylindrales bacterium]
MSATPPSRRTTQIGAMRRADEADPEAALDPAAAEPASEPTGERRSEVVIGPIGPRPARRLGVGPFSLRQVTAAIGVVVAGALALTLAVQPLGTIAPGLPGPEPSAYLLSSPVPGLAVGSLAPELSGTRPDGTSFQLADLDGQPIRLADLRGKVVWLNFWTSWCSPCQQETPMLRTMDQAYRAAGLAIIGVQVQQTVADGQRYVQTYGLGYRIGADLTGDVFNRYRGFALPTQFFIDQQGVIRRIVNGPLDDAAAASIVEGLLGLPPSAAPGASGPPA